MALSDPQSLTDASELGWSDYFEAVRKQEAFKDDTCRAPIECLATLYDRDHLQVTRRQAIRSCNIEIALFEHKLEEGSDKMIHYSQFI